jgi:hypothetical protein
MSPTLFRTACLCSAFAALFGCVFVLAFGKEPFADPTAPGIYNFYPYTFAHFEPFSLCAIGAFFLGVLLIHPTGQRKWEAMNRLLSSKQLPLFVALIVLLFTSIGRFTIHQNFDLCIDEYLNEFEGRILQQHHLVAEVPQSWISYRTALELPYQIYHGTETKGYWASGFLPGFAVLIYGFDQLDLGWFLNPLLAAISLGLLASLGRRAFPGEGPLIVNIAVLLIACSPQFLFMAMAKFAWAAHLCGTLFWIWLFTHPNRFAFLLTPMFGILLIGLHQPHVHMLVAAPFLLRLVYTYQWRAALWFAGWYLLGGWIWYQELILLRPTGFAAGGGLAVLSFSPMLSVFVMGCHSFTLYAWMTPLLVPLVIVAIWTFRQQPALVQDSLLASLLTFLFYFGFVHLQGHGWGYRYMHSVYGCLALAAMGGALVLYRNYPAIPLQKLVICSVVFSLILQIPYRAYEVRAMVRPMALTWNFIASRPTDFVLVRTSSIWYACDLIRNDPWLVKKPIIFDDAALTPSQRQALYQKGTVSTVEPKDVAPLGVIIKK